MALVHWTEQSIEDIDAIANYISLQSPKFASLQVQKIFEKVEILESQSFIGRVVPEMRNKMIRELLLGNYRIIYRIVSASRIDILTVHHSAMKLPKKRLRKN
jgi:addiction module RelE/StbE family toxin